MEIKGISLYDQEFDSKLTELRKHLKSRMNGKTTEQMQNGQITYAENYGVSLQHVKELASNLTYTPAEYKLLWKSNIREAMLIAAINFPTELATPDELTTWANTTNTADMAEQGAFFLFYRCTDIDALLYNLSKSTSAYANTILMFTAGRALIKGISISNSTISKLIERALEAPSITSSEARGMSMFLRQLCHKQDYLSITQNIADKFAASDNSQKKQIAFEVLNELETL